MSEKELNQLRDLLERYAKHQRSKSETCLKNSLKYQHEDTFKSYCYYQFSTIRAMRANQAMDLARALHADVEFGEHHSFKEPDNAKA